MKLVVYPPQDIELQKGFEASQGLLWNPVYQYESMRAKFKISTIFLRIQYTYSIILYCCRNFELKKISGEAPLLKQITI